MLDSRWLTNDGPLVRELTERLEDYLSIENLLLVGNGTLGLMIALKLSGAKRVFTTPFSFPATTSAALWSGVDVTFGDVSKSTFNLLPPSTNSLEGCDAILATHVYGNPCDLWSLDQVSESCGIPMIYDAAHAFGVKVGGQSVLSSGDYSVLSFHATKLFHCVEGGAIAFADEDQLARARELINFGYDARGTIRSVGINAKMNELEAAMGLAVLDEVDTVLDAYRLRYELYNESLDKSLQRQALAPEVQYNHSYFPVCFPNGDVLASVVSDLENQEIYPRRYFSPSLDTIPHYGSLSTCQNSQDIASRILCLPMYSDLPEEAVRKISAIINNRLHQI